MTYSYSSVQYLVNDQFPFNFICMNIRDHQFNFKGCGLWFFFRVKYCFRSASQRKLFSRQVVVTLFFYYENKFLWRHEVLSDHITDINLFSKNIKTRAFKLNGRSLTIKDSCLKQVNGWTPLGYQNREKWFKCLFISYFRPLSIIGSFDNFWQNKTIHCKQSLWDKKGNYMFTSAFNICWWGSVQDNCEFIAKRHTKYSNTEVSVQHNWQIQNF